MPHGAASHLVHAEVQQRKRCCGNGHEPGVVQRLEGWVDGGEACAAHGAGLMPGPPAFIQRQRSQDLVVERERCEWRHWT